MHACVHTHVKRQQDGARCLAYTSVPELGGSDHRPVACTLSLAVRQSKGVWESFEGEDEEEDGGVGGWRLFGAPGGGRRTGSLRKSGSGVLRRVEVCVVS